MLHRCVPQEKASHLPWVFERVVPFAGGRGGTHFL